MKVYFFIVLFFICCKKNNCIPSATCNDDTLEFGCKKDVCKKTGIKFYYPCKVKNSLSVNSKDC
jgi:hypothetical protein